MGEGGGRLVGLLEEFPPVFDPSAELADVNEVERVRGKCPGVFGVVDLEGKIWRHPSQSVIPCPRKIVYPEREKKGETRQPQKLTSSAGWG